MRVQLWSYNYDPEPTGIGPVSRVLAHELRDRGHEVRVVAAHPHYPEPKWGTKRLPYRENRDGIPVLRLPLIVGRATTAQRYRQELSFMAAQFAAIPALGKADVGVVVSPSFPALLPAIVSMRMRRMPWLLWLHDILPDGATATGLVEDGFVLNASRKLERLAYSEAKQIVVLSRPFVENLRGKGVPQEKLRLIYDPATREPGAAKPAPVDGPLRLLSMGNIGHSQGLAPLVRAFEADGALEPGAAKLVITGNGVAADDCRQEIRTDAVEMVGLLDDDALETTLQSSDVAFVSQHYEGAEFNIPSKLMNFMAYGLPVIAAVNPGGEVAKLVEEAGAGWVVDSSRPELFPELVARLAADRSLLAGPAAAARRYADAHFTRDAFARQFMETLEEVRAGRARSASDAD